MDEELVVENIQDVSLTEALCHKADKLDRHMRILELFCFHHTLVEHRSQQLGFCGVQIRENQLKDIFIRLNLHRTKQKEDRKRSSHIGNLDVESVLHPIHQKDNPLHLTRGR